MVLLIPPVPTIGAEKHDLTAAQATALHYCKANFAGQTFTNAHSGDQISVSMKGLKHTLHIAMSPLVRACYILPDILRNAERTGVVPDKRGRPDILNVHKYEIEMLDEGNTLIALVVGFQQRSGLVSFYDLGFLQR